MFITAFAGSVISYKPCKYINQTKNYTQTLKGFAAAFTFCRWRKEPFHPRLPRMQLAPGLPSPPACPAWTARRTWLWPALSHRHCNPGDQMGADNETNCSKLGLCLCSKKFSADLWHLVVGLITDLAVPQVAHRASFEQEDVVGVQRRGRRRYLSGLGVELISPPHLEEPGISVGTDPAGSVRTPLTDTDAIFVVLSAPS